MIVIVLWTLQSTWFCLHHKKSFLFGRIVFTSFFSGQFCGSFWEAQYEERCAEHISCITKMVYIYEWCAEHISCITKMWEVMGWAHHFHHKEYLFATKTFLLIWSPFFFYWKISFFLFAILLFLLNTNNSDNNWIRSLYCS